MLNVWSVSVSQRKIIQNHFQSLFIIVHIELFIQEIGVFKNQRRGGSNITNEYTEVLRIPAEV